MRNINTVYLCWITYKNKLPYKKNPYKPQKLNRETKNRSLNISKTNKGLCEQKKIMTKKWPRTR